VHLVDRYSDERSPNADIWAISNPTESCIHVERAFSALGDTQNQSCIENSIGRQRAVSGDERLSLWHE
jgi:hypothetical protein